MSPAEAISQYAWLPQSNIAMLPDSVSFIQASPSLIVVSEFSSV